MQEKEQESHLESGVPYVLAGDGFAGKCEVGKCLYLLVMRNFGFKGGKEQQKPFFISSPENERAASGWTLG